MRRSYIAAALLVSGSFWSSAQAAEVSEKGAVELYSAIVRLAGPVIGEYISVKRKDSGYNIDLDLNIFKKLWRGDYKTSTDPGVYTQFVMPLDYGLWDVDFSQDKETQFSMALPMEKGLAEFDFNMGKVEGRGVFDEALSYFRNAEWAMKGSSWSIKDPSQTAEYMFGLMTSSMSAETVSQGGINIKGNSSIDNFTSTIVGQNAQVVKIKAEKLDADVRISGLRNKEIMELIRHVNSVFAKPRTSEDVETALSLVKKAMPFVGKVSEDIQIKNLSLEMPKGAGSIDEVSYKFDFNGIANDSALNLSFSGKGIHLPEEFEKLPGAREMIPEIASFSYGITGLNLVAGAEYVFEHGGTGKKLLTPIQEKELRNVVFPDGKLHVVFNDIMAKSEVYDFDMDGDFTIDLEDSKKIKTHFVVRARSLDKTIKFMQQQAQKNPEFNTASFTLMMAQGMAQSQADGGLLWDIVVSEDKKIAINGRPFAFQ